MSAISANVLSMLQAQYDHEKSNELRYIARSARADFLGLTNTAKFFRKEAEGEAGHAQKVLDFITARNEQLTAPNASGDSVEFEDFFSMFETAMQIELATTDKLKAIAARAMAEGDLQTFYWLADLIGEQVEEENLYQAILDRFALCGHDSSQIQLYDAWIGELNG